VHPLRHRRRVRRDADGSQLDEQPRDLGQGQHPVHVDVIDGILRHRLEQRV